VTVLDAQLGFIPEVTVGTPLTVTKFLEFSSESLRPNYQLLASNNRRPGQPAVRSDRTARGGMIGMTGDIAMQPLSKGFGAVLKQAAGTIATTGPAETTVYTHTASVTAGNLTGVGATIQVGRPSTDGTVRAFTYAGCKTGGLSLATSLDGILECVWSIAHAMSEATATALATASYPSEAEIFTYVGGALTLDAVAVPITQCSVNLRNSFKLRRMLGNGAGLEPLENDNREVSASFTAEFTDMTLLGKVRAATAAAGQGAVVMTWQGPSILTGATTLKAQIQVTIPVLEFTGDYPAVAGPDLIMLPLSGVGRVNTSGTLITIAYQTLDTTP